jgi:alpha-beta hydrolase superfamily lysophospholipase
MRAEAGEAGIGYDVLHGFPGSGRLWRNQVPALADAGFQVIVPDLRGYGRPGKPGTADSYSFASPIGDVMAVLSDAGGGAGPCRGPRLGSSAGMGIRLARA